MNDLLRDAENVQVEETAEERAPMPKGWKKHHRWQWGWQKWLAVVDFIGKAWPKNP